MATYTPNLNLKKPTGNEYYDVVAEDNDAKDKIDLAVGNHTLQLANKPSYLEARLKAVKLELEDLSANTLGAIAGTGTFNLLSVPQDLSVTLPKLGADVSNQMVGLISLSENIKISANLNPPDYYNVIKNEESVTVQIKAYQFDNYRWESFFIDDALSISDYIFTLKNYSSLGVYIIVGETANHFLVVNSSSGGVLLLSKNDSSYVAVSSAGATTGTWSNIYEIPFKISYVGNTVIFTNQNNTSDVRTFNFGLMSEMSGYMSSLELGRLGFSHNESGAYYPINTDLMTFTPLSKIYIQTITKVENKIKTLELKTENIEINPWSGKTWYAFGTSLTNIANEGKYPTYLQALSGMILANHGVSGGAINNGILSRIKETVLTSAEVITLEGFVNDWYMGTPLGFVGDTTNATFSGAIYDALKYIMLNSTATVIGITDHTGRLFNAIDISTNKINGIGLKQIDYTDMFIDVCEFLNIPIIKAGQKSMINEFTANDYLVDQIHLNELGGEQFANVIWDEMKNMKPRL